MFEKIADGRTDLIVDYLSNGGNATDIDNHGTPLINYAAYYGDVTAVKLLLSKGEQLATLGTNYDLNGAVFHGHWQLTQFLLEKGADPNHPMPETGETPLHSSLCKANNSVALLIVQLLIAHGADPNRQTYPGKATGGFMRDVHTHGETSLHRAAAFGCAQTIQALLDAGADKTLKDNNGDSPLSWASWHLRPGKILSMLSFGRHKIHPAHIEKMKSDHGWGEGGGRMSGLLGKVHL